MSGDLGISMFILGSCTTESRELVRSDLSEEYIKGGLEGLRKRIPNRLLQATEGRRASFKKQACLLNTPTY